MNYNVIATSNFKKEHKKLSKRYKSLKNDVLKLIDQLEVQPEQGTSLGQKCFKIRLAINSKGKGKSAGGRVITHVKLTKNNVYLISIYDKSDKDNISDKELRDLIKDL